MAGDVLARRHGLSADGFGADATWRAVQRAAWDALYKLRVGETAPRDWTAKDDASS